MWVPGHCSILGGEVCHHLSWRAPQTIANQPRHDRFHPPIHHRRVDISLANSRHATYEYNAKFILTQMKSSSISWSSSDLPSCRFKIVLGHPRIGHKCVTHTHSASNGIPHPDVSVTQTISFLSTIYSHTPI